MQRSYSTYAVKNLIKRLWLVVIATPLLIAMFGPVLVASAAPAPSTRQQLFANAAQEFGVPENVLLALSYNESHWQSNVGMSSDGGYGLMDLRTYVSTTVSGRDGSIVPAPKQQADYYTLDRAAQLLNLSKDTLKTSDQANIRGAAAVLAQNAKQSNDGTLPTTINDWYAAVAEFSGAVNAMAANMFASDVYSTIKTGAALTTSDGQLMNLPASPSVQPNTSSIATLGLKAPSMNSSNSIVGQPAECPKSLNCRFIPAAYAADSSTDPTNYGNYDPANRPKDMSINYIYIHDGEGSYDSIINHFQDPTAYDSAQYVISSQGDITQMVTNEDVSWGVANWHMNMHGINIEHAGFAAQGASWFTPAMYQSSATLVRWLAEKYHIPMDRQHILGHDNIMYSSTAGQAIQHWDPGPFWDWNYFMNLVRGEPATQAAIDTTLDGVPLMQPLKKGDVVIISPNFATNEPVVTDCQTGTCVTLPKQGANFVYLYTQPSTNASLLSDPYLHADHSPGTTEDSDWGDKAPGGVRYVVAAVQGNWIGIWYAGQIGWLYDGAGSAQTVRLSSSETVAPRPGLSSIPVYTSAYPEASAYPSVIPVIPQSTPYTMAAGQDYTTDGHAVISDYYYDATINYSLPDDHMIVVGKQKFYEIMFNHHIGFVKPGDVVVR